jgi:RND family efflux transporter MFP subunit
MMPDDDHLTFHRPPADLSPSSREAAVQSAAPSGRRSSGARRLGLGALLLLAAGLALGLAQHYAQHREVAAAAEQQRDFVPRVRVIPVTPSSPTQRVVLPAETSAFEAANIYARASGYITQRFVDIGSHVKAGATLAVITAPELDHQIAQAQATLVQTEATLRQTEAQRQLAERNWGRDAVLVKQGWATRQQGDTDQSNLAALTHAAEAGASAIKAQQAQTEVLQQQKTYQRVVAPFDGVITQRNIDVGSLVQADAASGTFLFAMAHSNVLRIQLYVPQEAALGVAAGVPAVIRVPELPDHPFPGKVTRISNALDPATRTLLTEIDVANPDGELSPGMYCNVELDVPRKTASLVIPDPAVVFDAQGVYVYVVENGVAHQRKITEIRDLGTEIEVSAGVKPGELVIINPPVDLEDGKHVKIRAHAATAKST